MIKSLSLGRYTLTEAVEIFLAHQPKFDREALVGDLQWLVNQKKIFAYHPGRAKSPNSISTDGSGKFYWEDLNTIWLPHFENQKWCFAKPIEKLKPDWVYWRLMRHVELEAAIYLSLNVNPYWKVFTEHLDGDTLAQYQARLTQVISWIEGAEWLVGGVKTKSFIEYTKISLESFARWFGEKMGSLKRPVEFDELARITRAEELMPDLVDEKLGAQSLKMNAGGNCNNIPKGNNGEEVYRAHYMDSPIKNARNIACNKNDVSEIWGILLENAQSHQMWSPISDIAADGSKIICHEKTFTKTALRDYVKRRLI